MKKPSKVWKEFCQIINIIDIGIGKQQRKLKKLNKQLESLQKKISEYWNDVEKAQNRLKNLGVENERDAIKVFFIRRENIKSLIESLVFDVSIIKQELDQVEIDIDNTELEKRRLEKRKDILSELIQQLG
ncbi:hypothetical protein ACX1HO_22065 [Yersinia enterocolitica]|uniref:hypothetical protein n=1 Tax=Yersinia TaxID=629 RepID=UPI00094BA484|nr:MULTISPECIES: hypothetical protein [Yersinia]EKN4037913.1 hypothetical protein [Yersinia enterocolitica]MBW5812574.1 hypothetical protein [Yersinia kristensenii]MBW5817952.1 hypothetical protein [Yersinia kristensenii]MBW5829875.1 hypothetical protein [Yersinia kristensenii]MBW5842268.1 hypothetical protein [Yersinia kristensenii]